MSPRYSSVDSDSGFYILLSAHDYIWRERRIPLKQRIDTCDLLQSVAIYLSSIKKQLAIPPKQA